jgi:hypothetical protein
MRFMILYLFIIIIFDETVKSPKTVTPAKAGVQNVLKILDSAIALFHALASQE